MVKNPYSGKDYNGNYCNILLANLDTLEATATDELKPFVKALRPLGKVKKASFERNVYPQYEEYIKEFDEDWLISC